MTYEELEKQLKAIEKEENAFMRKCSKKEYNLKMKYINEHKQIDIKRFQRISVRLRITEETRKLIGDKHRAMAKNQLGKEYTITGVFNGWAIGKDGQLKPCFYGGQSYSSTDEVVKVELTKAQPEGDCTKCRCYKDGLCYMMGGKTIGKYCAVWKITDDMVICPKYEEIVEGGLWGRLNIWPHEHKPNVTFRYDKNGKKKYRLYSLNWNYYTEHSEDVIKKCYSFEPIDYSKEESK